MSPLCSQRGEKPSQPILIGGARKKIDVKTSQEGERENPAREGEGKKKVTRKS